MKRHLRGLLISTIVTGLVLPAVGAEEAPPPPATNQPAGNQKLTFGAIAGVVRNAAKAPIAGAMITAAKADGTGFRATISGSDGLYSFADVTPGEYSVSSQADGYLDTSISSIEVAAGKAMRSDIVIATRAPAQPAVISSDSVVTRPNPRLARPSAGAGGE